MADAHEDDYVPLAFYSEALDEIYALRRALAYEACVIAAHLGYKAFPKTRRNIASEQAERMRLAARGKVEVAYAGSSGRSLPSPDPLAVVGREAVACRASS